MLADIVLSFYIGASQTKPSDLHVSQRPRGNDATMHDVTWRGYPFRFEIYYGVRLTYTPPFHPWTQIALDYTHYKVYAETNAQVLQDGTWHGSSFSTAAPMRERVQSIEMTHGLNMLGVSVLQHLGASGTSGVYVGGGPVVFFPHTESRVDSVPHETGYDLRGSGFQAVIGARGCAGTRELFSELKYSRGATTVGIAQGQAQTRLDTVHELAGIDFHRCAAP